MPVIAPPSSTETGDPPDAQALEALIEEARRRARRRRAWYGISALLAAGAAAAGFSGFHHGGGGRIAEHATSAASGSPQAQAPSATRLMKNGPVTFAEGDRIFAVASAGRLKSVYRCSACGAAIESVAWSPDGKRVAYGTGSKTAPRREDGLHILEPASGRDRRLRTPYSGWDWVDLAWSRDGARLAFVSDHTILVVHARGAERLTLLPTGTRGFDSSPSWSPNGKRIVFSSYPKGEFGSGIYVVALDGSHRRQLAKHGFSPAWSPDGTRIAYAVRCGIRLMTPDGKDLTPPSAWKCIHIGLSGPPVWSPDGGQIAVVGAHGTYVMNADGSNLIRVATAPERSVWPWRSRPAWQPIPR